MFGESPLIKAQNAAARLARLLSVVVAHADGRVDIPYRHFDGLPADVKLIEHYDDESDCIILRTGVVNDEQQSGPKPAQLTDPKPAPPILDDVALGKQLQACTFGGYATVNNDSITIDGDIHKEQLPELIVALQEIALAFDAKSS